MDRRAQQIEAVLLPVPQEELHAHTVWLLRHAFLDVVGQMVVFDLEKALCIVVLDQLRRGLVEDVGEPHVPKMVLEVPEEVIFMNLARIIEFDAFQLYKIAPISAELLVGLQGFKLFRFT